MIYPELQQGKRTSIKNIEVSGAYVRHARIVLRHTPDAAPLVLSGAKELGKPRRQAKRGGPAPGLTGKDV